MRNTCPDTAGPKYFVLLKLLLDVVRIVFHTPALATSTENALLVTESRERRNTKTRCNVNRMHVCAQHKNS